MWRLLLFSSILAIVAGDCPDSFDIVRDGTCAGKVDRKWCNWADPSCFATSCNSDDLRQYNLKPVIIHSEEEQSYWTAQATQNNLFLGLVCNNLTHLWQWIDGSIVDYTPYGNYDREKLVSCELPPERNCPGYYCGGMWTMEQSTGRWTYSYDQGPFDVYCTGQLPPLPSHNSCSDGFASNNGQCYKIGSPAANFTAAQATCQDMNAEFASIHSAQENAFIHQLAYSSGATNGLFIGASIAENETFAWEDGSAWDYDNTYPGYPVDGRGDCLVMDTFSSSGQWLNADCSSKLPFVCVRSEPAPSCAAGPFKAGDNITSPGYPYDASIACDYVLSVDPGMFVQVTIEELQANSCCDRLLLTDAKIGGKLVAALSGQIVAGQSKTFTSNSNFMRVSWQPNGGVNVQGFRMTYRAVDDKWSTTTTPKTTTTGIKRLTTVEATTEMTTQSSTATTSTTATTTTSAASSYGSAFAIALLVISSR